MQSQNTSSKLTLIGEALSRRSRKLTEEVAEKILVELCEGMPLMAAAPLAGVHYRTAQNWIDKGQADPDGEFGAFALAYEAAEAIAMKETVNDWRDIGLTTKQWTAFATYAERRWPEIYARKQDKKGDTNVTVNVGVVEGRLQELHAQGEIVYDGG